MPTGERAPAGREEEWRREDEEERHPGHVGTHAAPDAAALAHDVQGQDGGSEEGQREQGGRGQAPGLGREAPRAQCGRRRQHDDEGQHRVLRARLRVQAGGGAQVGADVAEYGLGQRGQRLLRPARLLQRARVEPVRVHRALARERDHDEEQGGGGGGNERPPTGAAGQSDEVQRQRQQQRLAEERAQGVQDARGHGARHPTRVDEDGEAGQEHERDHELGVGHEEVPGERREHRERARRRHGLDTLGQQGARDRVHERRLGREQDRVQQGGRAEGRAEGGDGGGEGEHVARHVHVAVRIAAPEEAVGQVEVRVEGPALHDVACAPRGR
jgi:hypothetical protein